MVWLQTQISCFLSPKLQVCYFPAVCFPWFKIYPGSQPCDVVLVFVQRSVALMNNDCPSSAYYGAGFKAFLELLVANALLNSTSI